MALSSMDTCRTTIVLRVTRKWGHMDDDVSNDVDVDVSDDMDDSIIKISI